MNRVDESECIGVGRLFQSSRRSRRCLQIFRHSATLVEGTATQEYPQSIGAGLRSGWPARHEWPAFFDPHYVQHLELHQPTTEALHLLDHLDDDGVLINYVEVSIDLIFVDDCTPWQWDERFKKGFLQPWHGKMQVRSYPEGYTTRRPPEAGERHTGHWYDWYGDRPCKLTGETACFHFEGRHEGTQFVRRIGLHQPRDLISFDFDAYSADGFVCSISIWNVWEGSTRTSCQEGSGSVVASNITDD